MAQTRLAYVGVAKNSPDGVHVPLVAYTADQTRDDIPYITMQLAFWDFRKIRYTVIRALARPMNVQRCVFPTNGFILEVAYDDTGRMVYFSGFYQDQSDEILSYVIGVNDFLDFMEGEEIQKQMQEIQ